MARRTRSEFLREVERLTQALQDVEITAGAADPLDDLRGQAEALADEWRTLGEDQREKFDNLPEGLQAAPLGELLESRADGCEEVANDLDGIDLDPVDLDGIRAEVTDEILDEILDEGTDDDDTDVAPIIIDDAALAILMGTPDVLARVEARVAERQVEALAERLTESLDEIHGIEYQGE